MPDTFLVDKLRRLIKMGSIGTGILHPRRGGDIMSYRVAGLIAAIFVLSAANVQATLIDQFNDTDEVLSVTKKRPNDSLAASAATAVGGYRCVDLHWKSGSPSSLFLTTDSNAGELSFAQGVGEAWAAVTWNGTDSLGNFMLNQDFTADTGFLLDIAGVGGTVSLKMTVYSDGGTQSSTTAPMPISAGGECPVSFASFTGTAAFDDIDAIVLEVSGVGYRDCDIAITSVKTVPEPSSFVLGAIGVAGFLGIGRRWRSA